MSGKTRCHRGTPVLSSLCLSSWTLWCHELKVTVHKWAVAQGRSKGRADTSWGAALGGRGRIFLIHSHGPRGSALLAPGPSLLREWWRTRSCCSQSAAPDKERGSEQSHYSLSESGGHCSLLSCPGHYRRGIYFSSAKDTLQISTRGYVCARFAGFTILNP